MADYVDELMVPGYFGLLANIVTQSYPASSLITRQTLAGNPLSPVCSPIWTTAVTSPPVVLSATQTTCRN